MRCPTHVLSPMMADIPATTQRPLIASGVASYRSTGFSNCFVAASLAKSVPFISFGEVLIWPSPAFQAGQHRCTRSEEHTSELQSLMRISYAVFCLKKKKQDYTTTPQTLTPNL